MTDYTLCTNTTKEGLPVMRQLERIRQMRNEIRDVARRHNADRIFVFGSCARGEETSESDIDFLADFNENASLFDQVGLQLALAEALKRRVDVLPLSSLNDPYFGPLARKDMVLV